MRKYGFEMMTGESVTKEYWFYNYQRTFVGNIVFFLLTSLL
jgi:hypothetical protein